MVIEFTDSNFEDLALKADKPVVVDFWAEWCGPCRMIGPSIEQMADEFAGKAIVGKVNVDNSPGVAARFGIRNIPTVLFIKNGEVKSKQVGVVVKSALIQKLEPLL